MKKIIAITLFLCVFFISCEEEPEEDYSISEITITNIPAEIPVFGNEPIKNNTFKVYLNASNVMSEEAPSVAKGVKKIGNMDPVNEKYTVTIKLQNPNPSTVTDPNYDSGSWSGTANYFSIAISPQDVSDGMETIWMKAGLTLDKGKKTCDWDKLIDFRGLIEEPPDPNGEYTKKINKLFTDVICEDNDIRYTP